MQADAGELFIIPRLLSASTGPELNSCEARQGTYMGQPSHRPAANERKAGYMRYCSEASQRLIRALPLSTGADHMVRCRHSRKAAYRASVAALRSYAVPIYL